MNDCNRFTESCPAQLHGFDAGRRSVVRLAALGAGAAMFFGAAPALEYSAR